MNRKHRPLVSRRKFIGQLGAGAAVGLGALALPTLQGVVEAAPIDPLKPSRRRGECFRTRKNAAKFEQRQPVVAHPTNGEEELYPNKIASYSKALPHNSLGEVEVAAYSTLIAALTSGDPAAFEAITLGAVRKLTNPQSGLAFDLEGPDSHQLALRPAPTIAGAEGGGEMVELYWMALARDVNFIDYDTDSTIAAACSDLTSLSDFRGPKAANGVTPSTIFRGNTPGDLVGPYLSQFLWLDVPMGALSIPQRIYTVPAGTDYMTSFNEWLAVQNGVEPGAYNLDSTPRYIRNLRDMAEWVHMDALYQAYHQACLILLGINATTTSRNPFPSGAPFGTGNPYNSSVTQTGFGTFGGPHILALVTEVATRALKAVWYQKWFVHRRLRPEAFGGLVHNTVSGAATYPVNSELLNSAAVATTFSGYGSYLLPQAFPEGSPTHPSYGAGHATVAGACITILKAWFDGSFVIPSPVVPNSDGTALNAYNGPALTVGNELNKLAANIAQGRNAAGIHYRSDYWDSLKLGEQIAVGVLQENKACYNEQAAFSFTKFDGTTITI
jgi:hypothetical protein